MKRKIRILHVAQSAGGVDRYLKILLKYLDAEKFESIVVFSSDFKKDDYEGLVIAYETIEMVQPINIGDIFAIIKLRKLIRKYKPDVVFAHSSKAGAITRIANIGIKNKCLYNPHGWAFNMGCSKGKQKLYATIERIAAPFCRKMVCISEYEKESALARKICKEDKLSVIYNGIDIEEYEECLQEKHIRKTLNIPEEAFVVGMVGRLCEQKAPDVFIKVAKQIKKGIPDAFFILVGDGEKKEEIIEYAKNNGLIDSLFITGWVKDPMRYVSVFDVAVLLSRWEGFGLVLPEYMSAKKPIVASRVDAIPEIITDRETGILVNPDDIEGTSRAVFNLVEDIDLRNKIAEKGYIEVRKRFDAMRMAKEYEELLLSMLACHH